MSRVAKRIVGMTRNDRGGAGASRARARRALAALQAALLPSGLPVLPRAALGASYLLGASEAGGDWYDTIVRADGTIGLVVGDVVAHGVAAVAVMGQLRAVAHHCLDSTLSPAEVVTELDHFARTLPGARSATVCVALLQPATGTVRYCTAGHPAPLLVTATAPGPHYFAASGDGPLATGSSYRDRSDHMADGDLLLLYTDGVVERPGRHTGRATGALVEIVTAASAGRLATTDDPDDRFMAAQRVCDQTLQQLAVDIGHHDDATLLAVERHSAVGFVELSLPDVPTAVPTARAALDAWFDALRVDRVTADAVQYAVGEVVTNAVVHAHPDRRAGDHRVTVRVELSTQGELQVTVSDDGRWRPPAAGPYRGMGLALATELVDDVEIARTAQGTRVCLRRLLVRPTTLLTAITPADGGAASTARWSAPADDEPFVAALTGDGDLDAVLVVGGAVDTTNAPVLRDQLRSATEGGTLSRTVDLSGVTLLGSAAVQALFEARRRSHAHQEHLHLLAPRGSPARHVLELVGLRFLDRP